ncbi:MAG: hypothetical protein ACQER4_06815 [Bacteroidota bacterium]
MTWLWILLSYLSMELLTNLLFHFVSHSLRSNESRPRSIIKGILERLFLIAGLTSGYPHVIIAFAALKIGTRFQKNNQISNDYFLIGNFISILIAMSYGHFLTAFV